MPTYRIKDWSKHFENNRTRSLKELLWVAVPNKQDGDGYTELVDHPNGAAHLGAWLAIVETASKCHPRGTLVRDGDRPHDSRSLSRLTRLPDTIFDEAIPRLLEIGWLELVESELPQTLTDSTIPQDAAPKPHPIAVHPQDVASLTRAREKGMEGNGRGGEGTRAPALPTDASPAYRVYFEVCECVANLHNQTRIDAEVSDLDAWRRVLMRLKANGTRVTSVGTFLDAYRDELAKPKARASPVLPSLSAGGADELMRQQSENAAKNYRPPPKP